MQKQNIKKQSGQSCVWMIVWCMMLLPVWQACGDDYDDTELRNSIAQIESRLKAFEEKMNTELSSLKGMIEGKFTVSSCTYDDATGAYRLLLSDGTELNIPKSRPSVQMISFIEENGEKYWAVADGGGSWQGTGAFVNENVGWGKIHGQQAQRMAGGTGRQQTEHHGIRGKKQVC